MHQTPLTDIKEFRMKSTHGYQVLALLLGLSMFALPALAAEKHEIVFDRQPSVGDICRIQWEAASSGDNQTILDGKEVRSEITTSSCKATAVVEVLGLHEDKSVKRVAIKFEKFEGKHNDKPVKLDTSKRIIVTGAPQENQYAYENGEAITDDATVSLLELMFDAFIINDDEDETESKILYNLQDPKAVGQTWSCNNEVWAKDFAEKGIIVDPMKTTSEVRFLAVEPYQNHSCAKLSIAMDFENIVILELKKQGFKIEQADMKIGIDVLVPFDPKVLSGTMKLEVDMKMKGGADIPQGKLQVEIDHSVKVKAEYLPIED